MARKACVVLTKMICEVTYDFIINIYYKIDFGFINNLKL